ncbi:MAG: hypothetical protein H6586_03420 [Flavobacteriales bacterium]|nr:hypothetical protein [Flavobacteriales bacterium]
MKNKFNYIRDFVLETKHQNKLILNHKYNKVFFLLGFLFILSFQFFYINKPFTESEYGRNGASGFAHNYGKEFVYYYYYLDLFPLTTSYKPLEYSEKDAINSIKEHGDSLLMEYGHWSRLGENVKILLYLPNAYLHGSPENPSIILFNTIVFILALLIVYSVLWYYKYPLLGFLIALVFGSNPFLLYETYGRDNIFALLAVVTLLILSINFYFFDENANKKSLYQWIAPILSSIIIATAVHIRGENSVLIISCLFIYLTISSYTILKKVLMCFILVSTFFIVKKSWQTYFDYKFDEAYELVKEKGGNPYDGRRYNSHTVWHPIFCGLGDYDSKYGYEWNDLKAYEYAIPILKEKYNMDLNYSGEFGLNEFYDDDKKYYKKLELFDEYDEVVKNKVMHDITNDPLWYLEIISKRVWSVFKDTSPVWIKIFNFRFNIPINGLFVLPFLFILFYWKKYFELKLILFSLPLAISSLVFYSKGNSTFNSLFHLFFIVLVFSWLIEFVVLRLKKNILSNNSNA